MNPQAKGLIKAARMGNIDGVKAALAAGANIHVDGDDALYWAATQDHAEIVNLLLAAGANVHVHDDAALRWAAYHSHAETVRRLLAAGADPVVALKGVLKGDRRRIATTLDACAAALTSARRAALLDASMLIPSVAKAPTGSGSAAPKPQPIATTRLVCQQSG